jgi:peroxiredoxin
MASDSSGKALVFAAVVFAGIYLTHNANLNRPAPAFSLPETYGGRVDLASYRGQPVLLVFWTSSCGYCRQELPLLSQLAPEFRRKGISVIAIHLGAAEDARAYLSSNRVDLTSLVDEEGRVGQAYRVGGVPKLILVGADGKIIRDKSGMADESVLREWMDNPTE